MNLVARYREKNVNRLLCEQGRWHLEAGSFKIGCVLTLHRAQGNCLWTLDWLSVEVHMNAEALSFLRRCALGRQLCCIDAKQQCTKTAEYRSS